MALRNCILNRASVAVRPQLGFSGSAETEFGVWNIYERSSMERKAEEAGLGRRKSQPEMRQLCCLCPRELENKQGRQSSRWGPVARLLHLPRLLVCLLQWPRQGEGVCRGRPALPQGGGVGSLGGTLLYPGQCSEGALLPSWKLKCLGEGNEDAWERSNRVTDKVAKSTFPQNMAAQSPDHVDCLGVRPSLLTTRKWRDPLLGGGQSLGGELLWQKESGLPQCPQHLGQEAA